MLDWIAVGHVWDSTGGELGLKIAIKQEIYDGPTPEAGNGTSLKQMYR